MSESNNNNNSFSFITIAIMTIIISLIILLSFPSLLLHRNISIALTAVYGQSSNGSSLVIIHGGGTGFITCPDGSSKQAVISFVVSENSTNGKVPTANWNINELPSDLNANPGFVSGSFNSVDLNIGKYKIIGQKINETEFCQPPVSVPITISGLCSQNVAINVQFESNNPILKTGGSFTGDVTCSPK
ncbi:MAG TPA: hypothetical protein VE445_10535 [Nitrososphaeraceae archaeon]|jgi:hypothetical protein|nr:hypothetical protein [Nitrososphaeraceae archaeon]